MHTLVFVSGPNAHMSGKDSVGSMARTFSRKAHKDYAFFRSGVTSALRAGLDAMIAHHCDVALIARVSCALYAGNHTSVINTEF